MGHVYGDSTPFPYDVNFIEQIRKTVDCGVELMFAQEAIRQSRERALTAEQLRHAERVRLTALADALKLSMTAFISSSSERISRAASRILDGARVVVEGELHALDGHVVDTQAHGRNAMDRAKDAVYRAIEAFTLSLDLPNTDVSLRLVAGEDSYAGQVMLSTPFGVGAVFALAIPTAHAWGKPRRVLELSATTEVHLPAETGLFSKRVTLQPVRLDKLFVAEVAYGAERGIVILRKGPRSGPGYELEVVHAEKRILLRKLGEDGTPEASAERLELGGEDQMHIERLWNRIHESTLDLIERRQSMTSATFDDEDLRAIEEPHELLTRMVNVVAPVVQEIARRSGAPGELVLRRDLGEGRREEIYITKAELHEKVMGLPVASRASFDPFELSDGPRSPRAPLPSERIYLEVEPTNPGAEIDMDHESTKTH